MRSVWKISYLRFLCRPSNEGERCVWKRPRPHTLLFPKDWRKEVNYCKNFLYGLSVPSFIAFNKVFILWVSGLRFTCLFLPITSCFFFASTVKPLLSGPPLSRHLLFSRQFPKSQIQTQINHINTTFFKWTPLLSGHGHLNWYKKMPSPCILCSLISELFLYLNDSKITRLMKFDKSLSCFQCLMTEISKCLVVGA